MCGTKNTFSLASLKRKALKLPWDSLNLYSYNNKRNFLSNKLHYTYLLVSTWLREQKSCKLLFIISFISLTIHHNEGQWYLIAWSLYFSSLKWFNITRCIKTFASTDVYVIYLAANLLGTSFSDLIRSLRTHSQKRCYLALD